MRVEQVTPGPTGLGTHFEGEYARAGTLAVELVTFERPHRVTFRAASRIVCFDDDVTLVLEGAGTRLRSVIEARPQDPVRLVGPLMCRTMRRQFAANWPELKRALERETGRASRS
ncbi:MAG: hypothetical protein ACJ789_10165 [Thermomicrobiales bacterium]